MVQFFLQHDIAQIRRDSSSTLLSDDVPLFARADNTLTSACVVCGLCGCFSLCTERISRHKSTAKRRRARHSFRSVDSERKADMFLAGFFQVYVTTIQSAPTTTTDRQSSRRTSLSKSCLSETDTIDMLVHTVFPGLCDAGQRMSSARSAQLRALHAFLPFVQQPREYARQAKNETKKKPQSFLRADWQWVKFYRH